MTAEIVAIIAKRLQQIAKNGDIKVISEQFCSEMSAEWLQAWYWCADIVTRCYIVDAF